MVDRPGVEAQQCVELTGTNRSCGLTISLRQHRISSSQSVQDERARTRDWDCELAPPSKGVGRETLSSATKDAKRTLSNPKVSGGDIDEATPDPIPNSEVKLVGADGTAREAVWESRTLPGLFHAGLDWPQAPHAARRRGASVFCRGRLCECSAVDLLEALHQPDAAWTVDDLAGLT